MQSAAILGAVLIARQCRSTSTPSWDRSLQRRELAEEIDVRKDHDILR